MDRPAAHLIEGAHSRKDDDDTHHPRYHDSRGVSGSGSGSSSPNHPALSSPAVGGALRSRRPAIGPLLGLLLLVNLAMSLYQLPLNRVIERRICNSWYRGRIVGEPSMIYRPDGEVREELCKIDEVQDRLARLQLGMEIAWIGGDTIMTVPLGIVATRYGRRRVLLLNLIPRVAMLSWVVIVGYFGDLFSINLLVLAPLLSFLGGDCVLNSIAYSFAAGVTDDHTLRASYFGYMSSVTYVVNLTGPSLAAATMSRLVWLPFWIGLTLLALAILVVKRIPDDASAAMDHTPTPSSRRRARADSDRGGPSTPLISSSPSAAHTGGLSKKEPEPIPAIMSATKDGFRTLYGVAASQPRNFALLLLSMFLTSFASADTKLLVQYISKRYEWTFASAGYLLSGKAVVNFVLLAFIVPTLLRSRQTRRRNHHHQSLSSPILAPSPSAEKTTLRDAHVCLVLSVIGALAIAFAGSVWLLAPALLIYALGSALPVFTLSLLKSPQISPPPSSTAASSSSSGPLLSPPSPSLSRRRGESSSVHNHEADADEMTIFSIVMIVKTIGSFVGYPIVTLLWLLGMSIGGPALGVPYLGSSLCYVAAIGVLGAIRLI